MAFNSAAGHNNLPQGNFVPEIYSKSVLKFFRRASIAEDITNTDYYGEIANYGDTVHVIKEPTISIGDYTRGKKVDVQDLDDDEITLIVDQAKYFSFAVDDIEKKQAHLNWESLSTNSGAYSLKNSYDSAILTYMSGQALAANVVGSDSATTSGDLSSTSTSMDLGYAAGEVSPLALLSRLSLKLDEQDVPEENRWLVASPAFWEVMADENSKLMGVDFTGDTNSMLRNGRITDGLIRGFRPYKTNNTPAGTNASIVMAGHMSSTATASQINKTEVLRSTEFFGDVVRGLHMYGRKTSRPESLALGYYNID